MSPNEKPDTAHNLYLPAMPGIKELYGKKSPIIGRNMLVFRAAHSPRVLKTPWREHDTASLNDGIVRLADEKRNGALKEYYPRDTFALVTNDSYEENPTARCYAVQDWKEIGKNPVDVFAPVNGQEEQLRKPTTAQALFSLTQKIRKLLERDEVVPDITRANCVVLANDLPVIISVSSVRPEQVDTRLAIVEALDRLHRLLSK